MIGPGKYDDVCSRVREEVGPREGDSGGVVLIVIGGPLGSGFSCQADLDVTLRLPEILESVAQQIREDRAKGIV
jgi:hypothetical protein